MGSSAERQPCLDEEASRLDRVRLGEVPPNTLFVLEEPFTVDGRVEGAAGEYLLVPGADSVPLSLRFAFNRPEVQRLPFVFFVAKVSHVVVAYVVKDTSPRTLATFVARDFYGDDVSSHQVEIFTVGCSDGALTLSDSSKLLSSSADFKARVLAVLRRAKERDPNALFFLIKESDQTVSLVQRPSKHVSDGEGIRYYAGENNTSDPNHLKNIAPDPITARAVPLTVSRAADLPMDSWLVLATNYTVSQAFTAGGGARLIDLQGESTQSSEPLPVSRNRLHRTLFENAFSLRRGMGVRLSKKDELITLRAWGAEENKVFEINPSCELKVYVPE